eukprot:sb/3474817/
MQFNDHDTISLQLFFTRRDCLSKFSTGKKELSGDINNLIRSKALQTIFEESPHVIFGWEQQPNAASTPKTKSSIDSISCFILGLSPSYGRRRILSNRLSSYIGFIISVFCPLGLSHHHIFLTQINLFKVVLKS